MINSFDFIIYLTFYLFLIVAGYQYIRVRNLRRLMGLMAIIVIIVLYSIGILFFPRSPFILLSLPPIGLLWCIYYLTYPERRNRVLAALLSILAVAIIGAYLISISVVNH